MWLIRALFLPSIVWTTNKCFANVSPESLRDEQGLMMKSFINESIDPCDNFYNYACGNWAKRQTIDKGVGTFGVFGVISTKVDKFIEEVILFNNYTSMNERVQRVLESSEVKKIQRYFSICREQKKLDRKPYVEAWGVPGGWPLLNSSWSNQTFDWLNITAQLKLVGAESLIDVIVGPHHENSTRNTIYILPAPFPLFQPSIFHENPFIKLVVSKMISLMFKSWGVEEHEHNKTISDVLSFETRLADIYLASNEDDDNSEDIEDMTLETLQKLIPGIDFQRFLNIVSGGVISKSHEISVIARSYFTNILKLLNETESEVLANFFLYRFGLQIGTLRTVDIYCRNEVIKHMGLVLGYIYNTVFNDERDNEDVKTIAHSIKRVFAGIIHNTEWIDLNTKGEALNKLDNLLLKVGASDDELIFDQIKKEFALLDLDHNDYYKSYFKLIAYSFQKSFRRLHKVNDKTDTNQNTAMVRAFYNYAGNYMVIPTNILQAPIYNFHYPYSIKYGVLGSIVGHEITHSMDGTGRIYDSKGTIREWWIEKSEEEYLNRSECLKIQYANFTPAFLNKSAKIIGEDTLDENIADNGGIRQSYLAYKNWYAIHPNEQESLPHINLTNTQLFFLSYAQFYCEVKKLGVSIVSILTDEHSTGRSRVIGTLSNFDEFSKEFNCPVGSKMNPSKKCKVW